MSSAHDFSAPSISGQDTSLAEFKGKTLLVVNVASACGLTPQYEGLQALHAQYVDATRALYMRCRARYGCGDVSLTII